MASSPSWPFLAWTNAIDPARFIYTRAVTTASADETKKTRVLLAGLFVFLVLLSITPIQSYDYYWHLATGRWIIDNAALPETDPFSLSSDQIPWVDGEWLFQIGAAVVDAVGGEVATSVARGVVVAAIFLFGFVVLNRSAGWAATSFVVGICLWGADHRLTTRPETFATLFLVAALWLLLERVPNGRVVVAYSVLTAFWMAFHPSALLAPALAGLVFLGCAVSGEDRTTLLWRVATGAASGVALLVNPWFVEGVAAPLRLARLAGSGAFVNTEWLPTNFTTFPLVYLTVVGLGLHFILRREFRRDAARLFLSVFLAYLAIRYVRNHGFLFAALPVILGSTVSRPRRGQLRSLMGFSAAIFALIVIARHEGLRVGADQARFPVASVEYLRELGIKGNVYNPDQLGGYLINQFYPERCVVTDGRNELHTTYIREYSEARLDQRKWNALIERYELTVAVDEYHRETMDVVDSVTGRTRRSPASLIYFPREDWALVAFDDTAMVFLRRDSWETELLERIEYKTLVPDGAVPLIDSSPETIDLAREEIRRARETLGAQRAIVRITELLGVGSGR